MRIISPVPIEVFVKHAIKDRRVDRIFENLPVDRDLVAQLLIQRYRDMGIFLVQPLQQSQDLQKDILIVLQTAPEFRSLAKRVEKALLEKQKGSRHSED